MKKLFLLSIISISLFACNGKQKEAEAVAEKWATENVFKFYEDVKIDNSTTSYSFNSFDLEKTKKMIADLDEIRTGRLQQNVDAISDEHTQILQEIKRDMDLAMASEQYKKVDDLHTKHLEENVAFAEKKALIYWHEIANVEKNKAKAAKLQDQLNEVKEAEAQGRTVNTPNTLVKDLSPLIVPHVEDSKQYSRIMKSAISASEIQALENAGSEEADYITVNIAFTHKESSSPEHIMVVMNAKTFEVLNPSIQIQVKE